MADLKKEVMKRFNSGEQLRKILKEQKFREAIRFDDDFMSFLTSLRRNNKARIFKEKFDAFSEIRGLKGDEALKAFVMDIIPVGSHAERIKLMASNLKAAGFDPAKYNPIIIKIQKKTKPVAEKKAKEAIKSEFLKEE